MLHTIVNWIDNHDGKTKVHLLGTNILYWEVSILQSVELRTE